MIIISTSQYSRNICCMAYIREFVDNYLVGTCSMWFTLRNTRYFILRPGECTYKRVASHMQLKFNAPCIVFLLNDKQNKLFATHASYYANHISELTDE